MCIIRQIINQHSIIDSYPMMMVDKTPASGGADTGAGGAKKRQQDDSTHPMSDASESSVSSSATHEHVASPASKSTTTPKKQPAQKSNPAVMSEKIAQDVLVFKMIAERMPPTSLFHLLKADVLVTVDHTPDTDSAAVIDAQEQVEKEAQQDGKRPVLAPHRASKVRFASNEKGKLLRQVQFIDRVKNESLWWKREEMDEIRSECISLVEEYSLYKKEFERGLTQLIDDANDANLADYNENDMKYFQDHQVARGLERHIVQEFEATKQMHFEAIMDIQHEYRQRGTSERWKAIKKVSQAASLPTRYISVRIAQSDELVVRGHVGPVAPMPAAPLDSTSHHVALDSSSQHSKAAKSPNKIPLDSSSQHSKAVKSPIKKLRTFVKRTVSRRFTFTGC